MDPISQGALGAVAALCFAQKPDARKAALVGIAGGMLADADIFIRSASDPLLNIEYHRHFTHSLIFIPIGGLVCAALFHFLFGRFLKLSFQRLYLYSTVSYATAGLLDACTSYGTQLLWPFSNARVAWNNISIIDPLFTFTLIVLICVAIFRRRPVLGRYAASFALSYLLFGVLQRERASHFQATLAAQRGHHTATRLTVKPSIANLILWRSIYQYQGDYYIDALRLGLASTPRLYEGVSQAAFDLGAFKNQLPPDSVLSSDLDRFAHFSDHYLAIHPQYPNVLGDVRYAMLPNSNLPLWGIEIDPTRPDRHTPFTEFRSIDETQRKTLAAMLLNKPLEP